MNCHQCGAALREGAAFCPMCGTPVLTAGPAQGAAEVGVWAGQPEATPEATAVIPPMTPPVATPAPPGAMPPPPGVYAPIPTAYGAPGVPIANAPSVPPERSVVPVVIAVVVAVVLLVGGVFGLLLAGVLPFDSGGAEVVTTASTDPSSEGSAAEQGSSDFGAPVGAQESPMAGDEEPEPEPIQAPVPGAASQRISTPKVNTPQRQALMDAAREWYGTTSVFYVNQLYVQGDVAVGDIGAQEGGRRQWVIWRGDPWTVVFADDWGSVDEQVIREYAPGASQELIDRLDWFKPWPREFKFE